ncbi:MAG TPA: serine/threonine-protein kinase, partial [Ktedonobacteraceae bacterium]|nr:serine/threonine-protein kinase [Ktedonobacteraceae bacterium]
MTGFLGQTFGNYRVERMLGRGGFADVYLGRHYLSNDDAVAIKVLRDPLTDEKSKVEFQKEARMLLRLNHPGIVHLRDYGIRNDGVAHLIMDYAPNGSLDEKYPLGQRLALPDVVSHVKQIAEALQYAHNEGVIHCDIKPANLLLGNRNQIVIGDFGIATIAQATRTLRTGEPVGTIEF